MFEQVAGKTEREVLLRDAASLVIGDRNQDYGDPYDDFTLTSELWEAYLSRVFDKRGEICVEPHDVAVMMVLLKVSRLSWTPSKKDHWLDLAGYAACGWDCTTRDVTGTQK